MNFKSFIATAVVTASLSSSVFAANTLRHDDMIRHEATTSPDGKASFSKETAFNGEAINNKIADRFHSDFKGASGIWNIQRNYDEVLFIWHSQLMQTYYTKDGQLIGTYHMIEVSKLPAGAQATIGANYRDYQIKDASVIEKPNDAPGYFATLTGKGKIVKLQISADGDVNVVD